MGAVTTAPLSYAAAVASGRGSLHEGKSRAQASATSAAPTAAASPAGRLIRGSRSAMSSTAKPPMALIPPWITAGASTEPDQARAREDE